jgi:hypothetical protein
MKLTIFLKTGSNSQQATRLANPPLAVLRQSRLFSAILDARIRASKEDS